MAFMSNIKKSFVSLCLILALVSGVTGCASVGVDLTEIRPAVCLNDPVPLNVLVLKHFKKRVKAHFGLFGLITFSNPDIKGVIKEAMAQYKGNSVINVTIRESFTPVDVMVGLPLFPLWFQRTYIVEGDVVLIR